MRERLPQKPVIEQAKEERIAIPTIEEMRATENPFTDHARLICNTLQLTILELLDSRKKGYTGTQSVSPQDIKDLLQSPHTQDRDFVMSLSSIEDFNQRIRQERRNPVYSSSERERGDKAVKKYRNTPHCRVPSSKEERATWKANAPVILTSDSGEFYTNAYWDESKQRMTVEHPEETTVRVNLAVEPSVHIRRVLEDLYEKLCANPVLQRTGFKMKSLRATVTDAVIIYCGEEGSQAVLGEVARYCIAEQIGNVPGIAFGLAPLKKGNEPILNGLRISLDPDNETFNTIQAIALSTAINTWGKVWLEKDLGKASVAELEALLQKVRSERAIITAQVLQSDYETALRAECGIPESEDPIWNVAFPDYQPPEEL